MILSRTKTYSSDHKTPVLPEVPVRLHDVSKIVKALKSSKQRLRRATIVGLTQLARVRHDSL